MKNIFSLSLILFSSAAISNAAVVIIQNSNNGAGDTLYALNNNTPMPGGLVSVGYFLPTVTNSDVDTIPELFSSLGTFTVITSIAPGSVSANLGGAFAGYADQFVTSLALDGTSLGFIDTSDSPPNPLLNRRLYAIVTNASSLTSATPASEFGVFVMDTIIGDNNATQTITVNPAGRLALIGSFGTITGNYAGNLPTDTFNTFRLGVIPEPSGALLCTFSVLALLRRRRN